METKKCRGPCGEVKSLSEFTKDKRYKDGHLNICKKCINEKRNKKRKKNRNDKHVPVKSDAFYDECERLDKKLVCSGCGESKSVRKFNKSRRSKRGYNYLCKVCQKIKDDEYKGKNRLKIRERDRFYRIKNRDRIRKASRVYESGRRSQRRERKWRLSRSEKTGEEFEVFLRDKLSSKVNKFRREAHSGGYETDITLEGLLKLVKSSPDCYLCGVLLTYERGYSPTKLVFDHKIPVSRYFEFKELLPQGVTVLANIGCACAECNARKGDKTPGEFLAILEKEREEGVITVWPSPQLFSQLPLPF